MKWDGYRALALKHRESVRLLSLKEKSLAADFPEVIAAIREIGAASATIDGEIVAINSQGKPSFQMLQNRKSLGREWQIVYYAFDLLNLEGQDLRQLPLCERKAKLRALIAGSPIRYSAELEGDAAAVVSTIENAGLEGVIAKRRQSAYQSRTRSPDRLKLKLGHAQEFVIGGYNPTGVSFQSLLAGYYENGALMFAGKVRQGLIRLSVKHCLTKWRRSKPRVVHFRTCRRVARAISAKARDGRRQEKTKMGAPKAGDAGALHRVDQLRFTRRATFLGLRDDKTPREVVRE